MSERKNTVCAVVVTYNRKNLLLECLDAIRKQTRPVQGIYLIDNASTDGTPETLLENGYIQELPPKELREPWEKKFEVKNLTDGEPIKLHYVRMQENTGGAGGFYEGVKRGYEKGYDWLWLMDDDCLPLENCLEKQLPSDLYTITGPVVLNYEKTQRVWNNNYNNLYKLFKILNIPYFTIPFKRVWNNNYNNLYKLFKILNIPYFTIPFNGFLISKKAVEKIGLPRMDFFIYCDDVEYSFRATKNGINLCIIDEAVLLHPKTKLKNNYLLYYYARNNIIIAKNYDFLFMRLCIKAFKVFMLFIKTKNKYMLLGLIDGIIGKNNRKLKNESK